MALEDMLGSKIKTLGPKLRVAESEGRGAPLSATSGGMETLVTALPMTYLELLSG